MIGGDSHKFGQYRYLSELKCVMLSDNFLMNSDTEAMP
jgi:hypothetical protein